MDIRSQSILKTCEGKMIKCDIQGKSGEKTNFDIKREIVRFMKE